MANLPEEIWLQVAVSSTIDSIEALAQACRRLRTILVASTALWRAVVQDLLIISPNAFLSHSILHKTADALRSRALRFRYAEEALSTREEVSVADLELPEPPASPMAMLPGTACTIYQSDTGSVYILSLVGQSDDPVDHWEPTDPDMQCYEARIVFGSSVTRGLVVAFYAYVDLGHTTSWMTWVFHISMDPTPKLNLLLHYEMPEVWQCRGASVVDDILVMLWSVERTSEAHTVAAVNFSSLAPSRNGRPSVDRYLIARKHYHNIDDFCALTRDTVAVADDGHVDIFRLSASQEAAETQAAPPAFPCSTVRISNGDHISLGRHCHRQPDGAVYLDVAANAAVHTLRIAANYTKISRVPTWAGPAFDELDDDDIARSVAVGAQRIALVSKKILSTRRPVKDTVREAGGSAGDLSDDEEDSSAQTDQLILATRTVVARGEAERRLGTPVRRDFAMPLRWYNDISTATVSYDEWRGMGCVTLDSDLEFLGVAVFKV